MPSCADHAGERLDRDVGDAEEDAGRGAEHDAVVLDRGADARAEISRPPSAEQAGLEGDHRGEREARVRAVHAPAG